MSREGSEVEVEERNEGSWREWRQATGVFCDKRFSMRLKIKINRAEMRSVMIYGTAT